MEIFSTDHFWYRPQLLGPYIDSQRGSKAFGHEPLRKRKLLLRRAEIRKLERKIDAKGLTLVPLRLYFNRRGFAKLELGLCRGKQLHDKRRAVKERDSKREIEREISRF